VEIQLEADAGQAYPVVPADPDAFQSGLRRHSRPTAKVPTPLRTDIYRNTLGRNAITNTVHFAGSPPYSNRSYSWISEVHGHLARWPP